MTEVRSRLTERITGAKLKLEIKRASGSAVVYVVGLLVAIAGAAYIISNVAPTLIDSSRTYAFAVDNATAVKPGINELRFEGIPAGQITGVKLVDAHPVITVKLKDKFGRIYRNARAELRPNSALEDQYLDITSRGTSSAGAASASTPIPATQTQTPVDIDDVLDTFNAPVRDRLRTLLAELGSGLKDNGAQLKTAFEEVVPLLQVADKISAQLARQTPLTKQLVTNTGVLTAALGDRTTMLRELIGNGSQTVAALARSSTGLSDTIHELPGTLSAIHSSFLATDAVIPPLNTALRSLEPVAGELPKALPAVIRLAKDADPAVRALETPVRKLQPLANTIKPLSSNLNRTVAQLLPDVPVLNRTTTDLVNCKLGVQGFFQWDASMTKFGDEHGIVPRGNLVFGEQSAGIASPYESAIQACTPGGPIGGVPISLTNPAYAH